MAMRVAGISELANKSATSATVQILQFGAVAIVGAFLAKVVVDFVSQFVPQLKDFAPWSVAILGVLGAISLTGYAQLLAGGAAIMSIMGIVGTYITPFMVGLVPTGA